MTTSGFRPGDALTRAINLTNDGDVALSSVSLTSTATSATALTSDGIDGREEVLPRMDQGLYH